MVDVASEEITVVTPVEEVTIVTVQGADTVVSVLAADESAVSTDDESSVAVSGEETEVTITTEETEVVVSEEPTVINVVYPAGAQGPAGQPGPGLAMAIGTVLLTAGTMLFSNANGMSFGVDGSTVTGSFQQTVQPQSSFLLQGANGLSFNTDGSTVIASLPDFLTTAAPVSHDHSQYLTAAAPVSHEHSQYLESLPAHSHSQYLTTAALSNHSHLGYLTTAAPVVHLHSQYLTTGAQSNHSHGNPYLALTNLSGTVDSNSYGMTLRLSGYPPNTVDGIAAISAGSQMVNTGTIAFANGNGISFGMDDFSRITGSHNGLTTAALSNHSHAGYLTTAALSDHSHAGYLTTAALSNHSHISEYASVNHSHGAGSLALTNLTGSISSNSDGFTLSLAGNTGGTGGGGGVAFSAGTQLGSTGTIVFANSNDFTFGMVGNSRLTASYGAGSTAAASNHWHHDSGWIYYSSITGYLGTFSGTNATLRATSNSDKMSFAVSALPAGLSGSNGSVGGSMITLGNANNISFYTTNGSVVASYGGGGAAIGISAGTTNSQAGGFSFANSNGVSFGINGQTVTASAAGGGGGANTLSFYAMTMPHNTTTNYINPDGGVSNPVQVNEIFLPANYEINQIGVPVYFSHSSASNRGSATFGFQAGIYSLNGGTMSLISSGSLTLRLSMSSTAMTLMSQYTTGTATSTFSGHITRSPIKGNRIINIPLPGVVSLAPGNYFIGFLGSQSTATIGSSNNVAMTLYQHSLFWPSFEPLGFNSIASGNWNSQNTFRGMNAGQLYAAFGTEALPSTADMTDYVRYPDLFLMYMTRT